MFPKVFDKLVLCDHISHLSTKFQPLEHIGCSGCVNPRTLLRTYMYSGVKKLVWLKIFTGIREYSLWHRKRLPPLHDAVALPVLVPSLFYFLALKGQQYTGLICYWDLIRVTVIAWPAKSAAPLISACSRLREISSPWHVCLWRIQNARVPRRTIETC
jgi:hypothetical protein